MVYTWIKLFISVIGRMKTNRKKNITFTGELPSSVEPPRRGECPYPGMALPVHSPGTRGSLLRHRSRLPRQERACLVGNRPPL